MGSFRFLLAISVVIAHSGAIFGLHLVDSNIAVESFFVISGFYMALILSEKYTYVENQYKAFITARFLRILPLYWCVFFLAIAAFFAARIFQAGAEATALDYFQAYSDKLRVDTLVFIVFSNVFIFLQDAFMFLGLDQETGTLHFAADFRQTRPEMYRFLVIPQAWTLSIELIFYLIAPFIAKRSTLAIAFMIVASLIIKISLARIGLREDPWSYRFLFSEMAYFFIGVLTYRYYARIREKPIARSVGGAVFFLLMIGCITYGYIPFPSKWIFFQMLAVISIPFVFMYTERMRIDKYLGELSYPIYVGHAVFIFVARTWLWDSFSLGEVIGSIALAVLLKELVGDRIEQIRIRLFLKYQPSRVQV